MVLYGSAIIVPKKRIPITNVAKKKKVFAFHIFFLFMINNRDIFCSLRINILRKKQILTY